MAEYAYWVVDAFTDRPLKGNPAAVVPLAHWPEDGWLQGIAMEMNLSETAFLVPRPAAQDAEISYDLRWFTPKLEVDLCGHATLAAAKVLAEQGWLVDGGLVEFATRSGALSVRRDGNDFTLDFPVVPADRAANAPMLVEALGCQPVSIWRSKFDYLVEFSSDAVVRQLQPNLELLSRIDCRGVIVTAVDPTQSVDFISRFFAPAVGVDEDPVTGSAHTTLADFWGRRLDKQSLIGYQASARGGWVAMQILGSRVLLSGQAVVFAQGRFYA